MSAKGKPTPKKGISKGSGSKSKHDSQRTFKTSVLTYPFIKTSDNDHMIPCYSDILRRSEDKGVVMDDLNTLQLELESLLTAVSVRTRALQDQIKALTAAEERHDQRAKVSPLVPVKRMKAQERTVKKFKDTSVKIVEDSYHSSISNKLVKLKTVPSDPQNAGLVAAEINDPLPQEASKVIAISNTTPNKFWAFIEPFCSDITPEDVKFLESLLEENSNDSDFYKVPSLGRHYTLRWAEEDTLDDKTIKSEYPVKKFDKSSDGVTAGPLTQRLFSALMEENFVSNETVNKGNENKIPQLFKNFTVSNSASFERQIRKELEEQGILDFDEMVRDEETDEILQELKRCQAELKRTSACNVEQLNRLLKLANEELARQDLKKKLQKADNEVIKINQKLVAAKQNQEVFSKKEIEVSWKVLKDRDTLLQLIDSM